MLTIKIGLVILSIVPFILIWRTWPLALKVPRLFVLSIFPLFLSVSMFVDQWKSEKEWEEIKTRIEYHTIRERDVFQRAGARGKPCGDPLLLIYTVQLKEEHAAIGWRGSDENEISNLIRQAIDIASVHCNGIIGAYIPIQYRHYIPEHVNLVATRGGHIVRLYSDRGYPSGQ